MHWTSPEGHRVEHAYIDTRNELHKPLHDNAQQNHLLDLGEQIQECTAHNAPEANNDDLGRQREDGLELDVVPVWRESEGGQGGRGDDLHGGVASSGVRGHERGRANTGVGVAQVAQDELVEETLLAGLQGGDGGTVAQTVVVRACPDGGVRVSTWGGTGLKVRARRDLEQLGSREIRAADGDSQCKGDLTSNSEQSQQDERAEHFEGLKMNVCLPETRE